MGGRAMAEFTVNATRVDPYKGFNFRVKWGGQYIPGIMRVSALRRTTDVVVEREGGEPSTFRRSPGLTQYAPILLERGLTFDDSFENWANLVWNLDRNGPEVSLAEFRKDIIIDFLNEAAQRVKSFRVYRCWVSEYQALPDLDSFSSVTAIESITLENEGWERDLSVTEPVEP
jgi:phage tail-like protein